MESYHIRKCLTCGKELSGRLDKKYCDAQCRNAHHNNLQRSNERMILQVNRIIRKNRTILKTLCPTGKATVRREVLEQLHFNFHYFTHIFPAKGKVYYFSYEYGFMPLRERSISEHTDMDKVVIIQHQEFMNKPFDPWVFVLPKGSG